MNFIQLVFKMKRGEPMLFNFEKPLVVQKDGTIIVEANHRQFQIIQPMLSQMATLEKATLSTYTYRISTYSIWSAKLQGIEITEIINFLNEHCKYPLAQQIVQFIEDQFNRCNSIGMEKHDEQCLLTFYDQSVAELLLNDRELSKLLISKHETIDGWIFSEINRGKLKHFVYITAILSMIVLDM